MIPARRHFERLPVALATHTIDQPMLAIDAAGPPAGQRAAERFGLAGAAEGIAQAFLEQAIHSIEQFRVLGLPAKILAPRAFRKD